MFRILLAVALTAGPLFTAAQTPAPVAPRVSTIYFAHDPQAIERFEENRGATRRMVDQLVAAATGQRDAAAGWRSLVSPRDRVGIKVSAQGGRNFSTHLGVVEAIVAGLESAGVPRSQVIVWDRDADLLRDAGFVPKRVGYAVRSIEPIRGYDRSAAFIAPVLGKLIWGDAMFIGKRSRRLGERANEADLLSSTSYLATVLSRDVTKVINVPILADEAGCGVAGALYNMTVPNVDNSRRFTQPQAAGADSIALLYADERVGPKVVLHLMDGLTAQYAAGPAGNPNYAFAHATLYASKDPVALDATALRQLELWRKEATLPPIGARAEWLQTAAQMGLGNFEEARIDLRSVGAAR